MVNVATVELIYSSKDCGRYCETTVCTVHKIEYHVEVQISNVRNQH